MPQPALLQCCNPSAQPNLVRRTPEPCCQFPIRSSNDPRLKSNELSRSAYNGSLGGRTKAASTRKQMHAQAQGTLYFVHACWRGAPRA